mmetsp:Transcript_91692/g.262122  ORF Transcript_91692/g.262122 Transcript_91692/m.262122 type:complete len:217 (-) Transcript_91692:157-807(-)
MRARVKKRSGGLREGREGARKGWREGEGGSARKIQHMTWKAGGTACTLNQAGRGGLTSPPARKGAGICVASMMPTIPSPRSDHLLANLPSFSLYFAASEIPTDSTDKIATRLPSSLRRALLLSASDISSAKMSPAGVASASTIASAPAPAPAAPTTPAALLTSACPEPDEASRSSALSMAIARPPVALRLRTCSIPQPTPPTPPVPHGRAPPLNLP